MKGDSIIVEEHHRKAASGIVPVLLPILQAEQSSATRFPWRGSRAPANRRPRRPSPWRWQGTGFRERDPAAGRLFRSPAEDQRRHAGARIISWVGTQEVKLDLMDEHLAAFLQGAGEN